MRARAGDDLTRPESWTYASELPLFEVLNDRDLEYFGLPFYPAYYPEVARMAPGKSCWPTGWLETNVVQFVDPDHIWHDPGGHTFHLWMRAHTGWTNYAFVLKVVENDDGSMTTSVESVPSGKKALLVPCPGGHMKFHILYDEETRLYWMAGTQSTNSMCRYDRMPHGMPYGERRRLVLHFSRNMIDWCFAGLVAVGEAHQASRQYASMVIQDNDLHLLSRSGNPAAKSAHDGNLITFHSVREFRRLIY